MGSDWDIVGFMGLAVTLSSVVVGGGFIIVVGLALFSDTGSGENGTSVQNTAPFDEIHH